MEQAGLGTLIETYLFWRSPLAFLRHNRKRVQTERKVFFDMLNAVQVQMRSENPAVITDSRVEKESPLPSRAPTDRELWQAEQHDPNLKVRVI